MKKKYKKMHSDKKENIIRRNKEKARNFEKFKKRHITKNNINDNSKMSEKDKELVLRMYKYNIEHPYSSGRGDNHG